MPLLLLVVLPLLLLRLGFSAALKAKHLAEQQHSVGYPTAAVLEAAFEAEPEGVWPPKPATQPQQEQ